jgi:hypothetical protein
MDRQATFQKVRGLMSAQGQLIPQGAVTSVLNFEEQELVHRERWLVPNFENPGFFERGPSTALANMESAFGQLGPSPLYPAKPGEKDEEPEVGQERTVVRNGKAYKGRIQAKKPTGEFVMSFEGEKPDRDTFKKDELGHSDDKAPAAVKAAFNSPRY